MCSNSTHGDNISYNMWSHKSSMHDHDIIKTSTSTLDNGNTDTKLDPQSDVLFMFL